MLEPMPEERVQRAMLFSMDEDEYGDPKVVVIYEGEVMLERSLRDVAASNGVRVATRVIVCPDHPWMN